MPAVTMNPDVDIYLARSQGWPHEMAALRPILLGCGLDESIKWAKPCYSHEGRNIAIVQEMKAFLALMFFKGALLRDSDGVLEDQGPNSRSARRICFTSVDDVTRLADTISAYVTEAIAIEDAGLQVDKPADLVLVEELRQRLDDDPALEAAFEALTPGRQREYTLYVSSAKQATTRLARIDRCAPAILDGKGLRD
jgi:uncharacterized protein YdeI (YjbR/CyaY-like superfamily)